MGFVNNSIHRMNELECCSLNQYLDLGMESRINPNEIYTHDDKTVLAFSCTAGEDAIIRGTEQKVIDITAS